MVESRVDGRDRRIERQSEGHCLTGIRLGRGETVKRLCRHFALVLCTLLLTLFASGVDSQAYTELLGNAGFESGTSGWNKDQSTATIGTTSTSPRSGTFAGYITKTSGATGTVDLYQDVAISASGTGVYYTFEVYVLYLESLGSIFNNVRIRLKWYDASSGLLRTDEGANASTNADYQLLTMTEESPTGAATVRVMCHLNITTGQTDTTNLIRWDDGTLYRSTATAVTVSYFTVRTGEEPGTQPTYSLVILHRWPIAFSLVAVLMAVGAGLTILKRRRPT